MDPALREIIATKAPAKEMEAIIKLAKPDVVPNGAQLVAQFGDIATCRMQVRNIEEVWADDAVVSLKAPRAVGQEPAFEGFDDVGEGASLGANPTPFTGKGVIIGIVDWGFDFTHPNFLNLDGSTRFLAIWDQTVAADPSAAKYGYGKVHTEQQLNEALKTLMPFDTIGYHPAQGDPDGSGSHGTHVTDIAAGNGTVGTSGMAPSATLVGVHLSAGNTGGLATLGDSVRILEAIDFIAEMAGEIPLVINLSVGKHGGAHQGNSLVEQGMDNFLKEKPGRAIVNSAGNYFSAQIHASGRVMPGGSTTIAWEVDKNDHTPNELEVWYSHRDKLRLKIQLPNTQKHTVEVDLGENQVLTFQGKIVGRAYHRANEPNTGDNHIDIFLYKNAPKGIWRLTLEGIDVVDGRWHAWIERDGGCHSCQSKFPLHNADPSFTTGSICNGMYTIAVGAYDTRDPERKAVFFSSAGPTSDGRKKPNLLAPGMGIQAARSTRRDAARSKGELTFKSGTSMAAPHVTGAIALLFEVVGQRLPIERTRSLLLSSADPPPKGEERTLNQYGEGYLNVESLIDAAKKYFLHQKLLTMKNISNFREEESEELIFDEGENLFEEEDEAFMEDEFSYPEEADDDFWSDAIEDIAEQSAPGVARDFRLVLDSDARIRTPPPNLATTNEHIPQYTLVEVSRTLMQNGREYVFAKRIMRPGHSGRSQPWGWTLSSNLETNDGANIIWANVKQALVKFANQEYNFWYNPNIRFENDSAVFDRQKAYWGALRVYPTNTQLGDSDWQEKNDWSGAFISYIAAQAGAGTHFCYNRFHTCYIVCARTNREYANLNNPFWAYELTAPEVAWPEPGDIVCKIQPGGQPLTLNSIVCEDLAHCDIVEAVYRKSRQMITIGGDVDNRVARRVVHLNAQGFIDTMKRWEIDNAGKRQPPPFYSSQDQYFAIIKVRTSLAAAPVATGSSASGGTGSLPSSSTTTDFAAEMQAVEWGNSEDFDTEDTLLEDDDEFFYQNETEEEEEFEDLNTETETVWMEKDNLFSYENAYEYEEEEEGDEAADCGCHKTTMQEDMHTGQHSDCRACGEYLVEQAEAWMQTGTTEDFMEGFFIGGAIMSEAFSPHKNGNSQAKQMFDSIAFGKSTPLGESWEEGAEVIAMPKSKLTNSLLPGDIVLSRSYGDGKTWQSIAHNGELFNRQQAVAKGFSPDSTKPGIYLEVITMKPIRRHQGEGFVKRIGDEWGRLLPDCMVVRARLDKGFSKPTGIWENASPQTAVGVSPWTLSQTILTPPPITLTGNPPVQPHGFAFAALPPNDSYWPLLTRHPTGRLVSYKSNSGKNTGRSGRIFLADRQEGGRWHIAIDLFAYRGDTVVACEDGEIVAFLGFYYSNCCEYTYSLLVKSDSNGEVINYGEVTKDSLSAYGLKVGDWVKAGQPIAIVSSTDMLHVSMYTAGTTTNPRWMKGDTKPTNLLNPTNYLRHLQANGKSVTGNLYSFPAAPTGKDWTDAINKNCLYGKDKIESIASKCPNKDEIESDKIKRLGWSKYRTQIIELFAPSLGGMPVPMDEVMFTEGVYLWQLGQSGLTADGELGPKTWARMKPLVTGKGGASGGGQEPNTEHFNYLMESSKGGVSYPLRHGNAIPSANGYTAFGEDSPSSSLKTKMIYVSNTELNAPYSGGNFDFLYNPGAREAIITFRVWLSFRDKFSTQDKKDFASNLQKAVNAWDEAAELQVQKADGDFSTKIRLRFQLQIVQNKEHANKVADVYPAGGTREKVIRDFNVNINSSFEVLAHELGHVWGLEDEYDAAGFSGWLQKRLPVGHVGADSPFLKDKSALMNEQYKEFRVRYFTHFGKKLLSAFWDLDEFKKHHVDKSNGKIVVTYISGRINLLKKDIYGSTVYGRDVPPFNPQYYYVQDAKLRNHIKAKPAPSTAEDAMEWGVFWDRAASGKMEHASEAAAMQGAWSLWQNYETVEVKKVVTGSQTKWEVRYDHWLPAPPDNDRLVFDTSSEAQKRSKVLWGRGIEASVESFKDQGKTKHKCKILKYFAGKQGPSLPTKTGWDEGFTWNKDNARRRAEGLIELKYDVQVEERTGRDGTYHQVKILKLPVFPIDTLLRSKWHNVFQNASLSPVAPLVDGKETFARMVEAIQTAKDSTHYIYLLGWMLDVEFELIPGNPNSTLLALLKEANRRQVEVRILVWDNLLYPGTNNKAVSSLRGLPNVKIFLDDKTFGSSTVRNAVVQVKSIVSDIKDAIEPSTIGRVLGVATGVLGTGVNYARDKIQDMLKPVYDFVDNLPPNEGSHHEKVLIVKGEKGFIGFCGGLDINSNRFDPLHDIQCRVEGRAAWDLLQRFVRRWEAYPSTSGLQLKGKKEAMPATASPKQGNSYVKMVHTYNHWNGSFKDRSARNAILSAIRNAERSFYFEDQYMTSLDVAALLNQKLNSGAFSVEILIQDDRFANDILFPKKKRLEFIERMERGLDAAKKRQIRINQLSLSASSHQKVHSKLYIADDELAIIGSVNCSRRSLTHDSETAAVVFDDPTGSGFVKKLRTDLHSHYQPLLMPYVRNGSHEDLDDKVMNHIAWKIAAVPLGSIVTTVRALLNSLWRFAWEVADPNDP